MQCLGWASTLEAVGWAMVVCGRAFAAVHSGPQGIYIRMQRPAQLDLAAIADLKGTSRAYRVFVEPNHTVERCDLDGVRRVARFDAGDPNAWLDPLADAGWQVSTETLGPSKTHVVSLEPPLDALMASFSRSTRRNLRYALERWGTRFEVVPFGAADAGLVAEVETLYRKVVADHPHIGDEWAFRRALKRRFGPGGDLILARQGGVLTGTAYLLRHDRVATYYAAFAAPEARPTNVATGLVWAAMRHARAAGCDRFDFYGVYDERRPTVNTSYKGFTAFKERFGGRAVYYPPSFDA